MSLSKASLLMMHPGFREVLPFMALSIVESPFFGSHCIVISCIRLSHGKRVIHTIRVFSHRGQRQEGTTKIEERGAGEHVLL
jgi:hypothetical protein